MEAPPDLHLRPRRRLLRSKTGCLTCRRRKKKCDEKTPVCGACSKNDLPCEKDGSFRDQSTKVAATFRQRNSPPPPSTYPSAPGGNLAESSVAANSLGRPRLRTLRNATSGESSLSWITTRGDNLQEQPVSHDSQNTIDKTSHVGLSESEEETVSDFPGTAYDEETPPSSRASSPTCSALSPSYNMSELQLLSMARGLNVNPPEGVMHSELLSHYLTETSIAISNGATSVNPFIVQLIPLAFTDPLLLQLLLAQAAAHRAEAAGSGPSGVVQRYVDSARTYYTQAIRAYRDALGTYLLGNKERLTILAIGSLTLCVTELARGDLEGASFSHLQAAKSLLMDLVSSTNSVPKKLMSFIVEFYLFNATLSMISMDVADRPHLDAQLQQAGHSLVAEHYVGHLCGCWLSLLMLIPDIVNLKHQIDSQADGTGRLSANCVVTFASLQLKIAQYQPAAQVEHEVLLSGKVYQQTVMLYLLTTMSVPGQPGEGTHRQAIDNAIMQSLEHMQGIPLAARISTTLLWPLTVLGSCTADESMRDLIRARLGSMSETLGFATMRNTLHLLEHIWKEGRTDNGPWTMWRAMRERQIWLLFA